MNRLRRVSVYLALVLLFVGVAPIGAFAEVADNPTVEVQLWPEGEPGYSLLIITVELPEGTALPVDVQMPLPEGAQVVWAGEIVGGGPENDIERDYRVVEAEAGSAVEITLSDVRTAQYEALYEPLVQGSDGISTSLDWLQTVPSDDVFFSIRIPARAGTVEIVPEVSGIPQTNEAGERLYTIAPLSIPVGESFTLDVAYELQGLEGTATGTNGGSNTLMTVMVVLLVVAFAVLLVVVRRQGAAGLSHE